VPSAPRRSVLELVVPVAAGATVFAFATGSSSVDAITRVGRDVRWAALLLLLVLGAAWAFSRTHRLSELATGTAAAAAAFALLALVSSLWSIAPRLSAERAISFALLLATALLLGAGVRARPAAVERLLLGLVGGAVAIALAGLVLLVVDHGRAVAPATIEVPARFQGLGQNPNTGALLYGIAVPVALGLLLGSQDGRRRLLLAAALVLLVGSIVASGSRGGLAAAGLGALVPALAAARRPARVVTAAAAVAACVAVCAVIQSIPRPTPIPPPPPAASGTAPAPAPKPPRYIEVEGPYPLDADVGRPLPGNGEPTIRRGLFATSGRAQAWLGALHQALERPLLGFGFGTEARVFVDRYYTFVGGLPENSYLGIALQLGAIGLAALLALVAVLLLAGRPAFRDRRRLLAASCAGAVLAGLTVAIGQSFVYSAGNIAAGTFWICAFLLSALAAEPTDG
jgi:O-antigen ligase